MRNSRLVFKQLVRVKEHLNCLRFVSHFGVSCRVKETKRSKSENNAQDSVLVVLVLIVLSIVLCFLFVCIVVLTLNGGDSVTYELTVQLIPLHWQSVEFALHFLLAEVFTHFELLVRSRLRCLFSSQQSNKTFASFASFLPQNFAILFVFCSHNFVAL